MPSHLLTYIFPPCRDGSPFVFMCHTPRFCAMSSVILYYFMSSLMLSNHLLLGLPVFSFNIFLGVSSPSIHCHVAIPSQSSISPSCISYYNVVLQCISDYFQRSTAYRRSLDSPVNRSTMRVSSIYIHLRRSRDGTVFVYSGVCYLPRSSLHSVRFGQLLSCAHKRIVNIMKVYIETKNMQGQIIPFLKLSN